MRPSGRAPDEIRPVSLETGTARHAEGSCLVRIGDTHVLCTASLEERVPPWLLADTEALIGRVVHVPQRDEIQAPIEEQMIVEFYSRV